MNLEFNKKAFKLVEKLIKNKHNLNIFSTQLSSGSTVIDCGVRVSGSFEAGTIVSEIGMGGFAQVAIVDAPQYKHQEAPSVAVDLKNPGVVTLCSQGAFPIFDDQKSPFYISGPGRVVFREPKEIYEYFQYEEVTEKPVFIIEDNEYPDDFFVAKLARRANIDVENFTFVVVPIPGKTGNVEVASKTIEDVMFNLFLTFHWDIRKITRAKSVTPVLPVFTKDENSHNLTPDDYIFYGGEVELFVKEIDQSLREILPKIVFENTAGFGKLFYEMVKEAGGNVRNIKGYPYIFSPAKITVISQKTGEQISAGSNNMDYLRDLINSR